MLRACFCSCPASKDEAKEFPQGHQFWQFTVSDLANEHSSSRAWLPLRSGREGGGRKGGRRGRGKCGAGGGRWGHCAGREECPTTVPASTAGP